MEYDQPLAPDNHEVPGQKHEAITIPQVEDRIRNLTAGTNKGVHWLYVKETHEDDGSQLQVQYTLDSPREFPSEYIVRRLPPARPGKDVKKEEYKWPAGQANEVIINNLEKINGIVTLVERSAEQAS